MDDLIIPGSLTVNQNITVGGGFAIGSLSVGNFIDSTAIQFDSLETFVDTTQVRIDSLETFMDSALVRLDTLENRTPLQGKPGYDGNSSVWRGVAANAVPPQGSFSWDEDLNTLVVSATNQNNTDMAGWISAIDAGDVLTIRKAEESETEAFFQVVNSQVIPVLTEPWQINWTCFLPPRVFSPWTLQIISLGILDEAKLDPLVIQANKENRSWHQGWG